MVPRFKVQTEVKARELEETLNELAKKGWELIPQTFSWDSSMRWCNFLMIAAPSMGGVFIDSVVHSDKAEDPHNESRVTP